MNRLILKSSEIHFCQWVEQNKSSLCMMFFFSAALPLFKRERFQKFSDPMHGLFKQQHSNTSKVAAQILVNERNLNSICSFEQKDV